MPRRHFLDWNRPLLPQAVEWLAKDWNGGTPLDLTDTLVVVPTRQSGRRLREALAGHAAKKSQAVLAPRVMTPDRIINPLPGVSAASRLEALLAWIEVLRQVDLGGFRSVFPVDPPAQSFSWALALAQQLTRLQRDLGENGFRVGDVAGRLGADFPEENRWRGLAGLAELQGKALSRRGLGEPESIRIEAASQATVPGGVGRIVVMGSADPIPLAVAALAALARKAPVEVLVFAPENEAASFDEWGRPIAAAWSGRVIDLPDFEKRVHRCVNPDDEAARIARAAAAYPAGNGFAIGVADGEVLAPLEAELTRGRIGSFNPEGRSRRSDGFHQLGSALAALARDDSFASAALLARCPDFLDCLARRNPDAFSPAAFLAALDELNGRHLPPTLAEAQRHSPGNPGLQEIAAIRRMLTSGSFPENATEALTAVLGGRRLEPGKPDDARTVDALASWAAVVREIGSGAGKFEPLAAADGWEIALALYGSENAIEDRPAEAVDLQGWLELLWEDAPHLAVAGLNEGSVPESVVGDAFLPESLRVRLGLRTNAARFARDAYFLQAIAACRAEGGRLDLLVTRSSASGDPQRPSRLLFRCPDSELPGRVGFLFGDLDPGGVERPPWRRAWMLRPERRPAPTGVSVTGMRRWLECPFRFYLDRVLKLEAVDPEKAELDDADFGNVCHEALRDFGRDESINRSAEPRSIRDYLHARLEAIIARDYGVSLTLPLIVQVESARQRLARAAEIQARTRAEGWVIESPSWVEWKFKEKVEGMVLSGTIDRIDRHEGTGALRVLDYKTSNKPRSPSQAHLRSATRGEFEWTDLQLPVYVQAVKSQSGSLAVGQAGGVVECGYFNLPRAAADASIVLWDDYTTEHSDSARSCLERVVRAIRDGEFWPPSEDLRREFDSFAPLFHRGAAASVHWEGGK